MSHVVADSAENKLDAADEEYVMVDKPTDDDMWLHSADQQTTASTAADDELKADDTATAPTTPHKQSAAKRRSELESDFNFSPAISLSRSGRQRKPPAAFTPFAPSERPHVEQQSKGQGTPLADIPNVVRRIDNSKSDSAEIRRFYSLCFPLIRPPPHKSKIKSVLKTFSGLTTDEQRHSAKGKLKRMWKEEKPVVLYRLMLLMDLDYVDDGENGTAECHEVMMKWLDGPVASGREFVTVKPKYAEKSSKKKRKRPSSSGGGGGSKKKRSVDDGSGSESGDSDSGDSEGDSTPRKSKSASSSSSSKKTKAKSGDKPKKNTLRTANSFVVFTSAKREEVRAAYPSLTAQEVTSKMGELWRGLPAEEKEVYELAAKRLREDALDDEKNSGGRGEGTKKKKVPAKGEAKTASAKKQKKSAAEVSEDRKEDEEEDDSDSGHGGENFEEGGSDSGTEDEDDVKASDVKIDTTVGNTNGGGDTATIDTDSTAAAQTESNASTPSNAIGDAAMKTD